MLSIATGFAVGPFRIGNGRKSQSVVIKVVPCCKLLDMGKGEVPKFGVPAEPDLLKRGEILAGVVEDIVESCE